MTVLPPGRRDRLSPNQLAKQEQIVDAARKVLVRDGLAGCTARSIADAGPLTKSAIHYYFSDIDLLIDRAVAALVTDFLTELRRVAEKYDEPRERLWAVLETYLDTFAEHPNAAFAWFEYWVAVGRADNVAAAEVTLRSVIELLTDLLGDVGIDDPRARARALQSYLLGAVVQQHVRRRPFAVLREEIELLCLP
ncbi:AcrR family transcriptional regulator [Amycolatopsis bartoniae]|uniref:TetR family transcriptional regulator n=1 Tax=Amycolatopsis bartoniae TaxID=941986 RepID=A0A8H9MFU3_9PSEU|nr:TetR family transcriptional regulator C-terminal domain-containing protein [Amycolatopsis bartoniae]MBB2935156.1 AcrR family transcriptional regulator [Amycolatopsis bartoniae]TVT07027.1 TetR/AcrR family transcriptional regulator [Amycolatopsis bartoniae]GHF74766.1 TetR family transcriptional regulator [Amycolatopsis bartoniae]